MRRIKLIALPIVLVATSLLVACGGGGAEDIDVTSIDATPSASLSLKASSLKYDKNVLVTTANTDVTLVFNNDEGGVLHNVHIAKDSSYKELIFASDLISGKKTETYNFKTSEAGDFYFKCDAHPDMEGRFIVR